MELHQARQPLANEIAPEKTKGWISPPMEIQPYVSENRRTLRIGNPLHEAASRRRAGELSYRAVWSFAEPAEDFISGVVLHSARTRKTSSRQG